MIVYILYQAVGVLAHLEEISFLDLGMDLPAADRAAPVLELRLGVEGLTLLAVKSVVLPLVDVALVIHVFEYLLDRLFMIIIRSPDELVIGDVHEVPYPFDLCCGTVHKFLGSDALLSRTALILLTVLIRSGLKKDIIALLPFEAGYRVSHYDLVGVSYVGLPRSVGYCRCNIIFSLVSCHIHHYPLRNKIPETVAPAVPGLRSHTSFLIKPRS